MIFIDKVDKPNWNWKDPKDTTVASEANDKSELLCFTTGKDEEHSKLTLELFLEDPKKF